MLSKFEIALKDSENDINRNMGSLFHGALMEMVSRDYGDYLHENHLKPFSQSISKRDDEFKWIVNCLDRESSEIFNDILMNRLDKEEIKNKNKTFEVISKNMQTITYKNLNNKDDGPLRHLFSTERSAHESFSRSPELQV